MIRLFFTCDDNTINLHNTETNTNQVLYSGAKNKSKDEFSYLKCFSLGSSVNKYLFASNDQFLQLFDINTFKQVNKYKFSKETINCIELNQARNVIGCCDDSGEIKILDIRIKASKNKTPMTLPTITLKKTFTSHSNICSMLKFNPTNENEIFSSSFDCSVIKWDLRSAKNSEKPYLNAININDTIRDINKSKDSEDFLISTMTPCFVHCLDLIEKENKSLLFCGIENGLCILYDAENCSYLDHSQLQKFNCGLTQLTQASSMNGTLVGSGNGKTIEFFDLDKSSTCYSIRKLDDFKIDHNDKVNCLRYFNKKLFVADTTDDVTIYDLNTTES